MTLDLAVWVYGGECKSIGRLAARGCKAVKIESHARWCMNNRKLFQIAGSDYFTIGFCPTGFKRWEEGARTGINVWHRTYNPDQYICIRLEDTEDITTFEVYVSDQPPF